VNDEQTQQADDPSGDGWRDVKVGEILQPHDMFRDGHNVWAYTENTGVTVRDGWQRKYRRRIEPQQQPQTQQADDPSGPDNQLANRIRAAMLASGLTRYQLSQQTGVSQAVLGRFASGKRDLTLSTASRLVPALGLRLETTTKRRPKA